MLIKRIKIQNFRSTELAEFTFDNMQKVWIKGKNGTGKTTIMDAYFWCFTGKLANGTTKGFQPRIKYDPTTTSQRVNEFVISEVNNKLPSQFSLSDLSDKQWLTNQIILANTDANNLFINTISGVSPITAGDIELTELQQENVDSKSLLVKGKLKPTKSQVKNIPAETSFAFIVSGFTLSETDLANLKVEVAQNNIQTHSQIAGSSRGQGEIDLTKVIYVEVELDIDGRSCIFKRKYTNGKTGITSCAYSVDGREISCKKLSDFEDALYTNFNIDVNEILFLSHPEISWEQNTDKKEIREKIFSLVQSQIQEQLNALPLPDKYRASLCAYNEPEIIATIQKDKKILQDEILMLEGAASVSVGIEDRAHVARDIEQLTKEKQVFVDKINKLREDIIKWEVETKTLTTQYNVLINQKNDYIQKYNNTQKLIQQKSQEYEVYIKTNDTDTLKTRIAAEVQKNYELQASQSEAQQKQLQQQKIQAQKNRIAELKAKWADGKCPTCGQPVPQVNIAQEEEVLKILENEVIPSTTQPFDINAPHIQQIIETKFENDKTTILNTAQAKIEEFNNLKSQAELFYNEANNINPQEPDKTVLASYHQQIETAQSEIKGLELQANEKQNEIAFKQSQISLFDKKIKALESLDLRKQDLEQLTNDEIVLTNHLESSIKIATDFVNERLTFCKIKLFEKTKGSDTIKPIFTIQETQNYAQANEMNNGSKIRCSVEITLLMQRLANKNFPIWIDEASRLDNLDFVLNIPQQTFVLEPTRDSETEGSTLQILDLAQKLNH